MFRKTLISSILFLVSCLSHDSQDNFKKFYKAFFDCESDYLTSNSEKVKLENTLLYIKLIEEGNHMRIDTIIGTKSIDLINNLNSVVDCLVQEKGIRQNIDFVFHYYNMNEGNLDSSKKIISLFMENHKITSSAQSITMFYQPASAGIR